MNLIVNRLILNSNLGHLSVPLRYSASPGAVSVCGSANCHQNRTGLRRSYEFGCTRIVHCARLVLVVAPCIALQAASAIACAISDLVDFSADQQPGRYAHESRGSIPCVSGPVERRKRHELKGSEVWSSSTLQPTGSGPDASPNTPCSAPRRGDESRTLNSKYSTHPDREMTTPPQPDVPTRPGPLPSAHVRSIF